MAGDLLDTIRQAYTSGDGDAAAAATRLLLDTEPTIANRTALLRLVQQFAADTGMPRWRFDLISSFRSDLLADALVAVASGHGFAAEVQHRTPAELHRKSQGDGSVFHVIAIEGHDLAPGLYGRRSNTTTLPSPEALSAAILDLVDALRLGSDAPILVNDLALSTTHSKIVVAVNRLLREKASTRERVHVLDCATLVAKAGAQAWYDERLAAMGASPLSADAALVLAKRTVQATLALAGRTRKIVFTDLDGILWDGALAEDGADRLKFGMPFQRVQELLLDLKRRGILIAALSKNDPDQVAQLLTSHPQMRLRPGDFVAIDASWEPKPVALLARLQALALAPDQAVFLDDSPVERAEMRARLPAVLIPEYAGAPEQIVHRLQDDCCFAEAATAEDRTRSELYRHRDAATALRSAIKDRDAYLSALEMAVTLHLLDDADIARAAQLAERVNQFNATAARYTAEQLVGLHRDPTKIALLAELRDKFGAHGRVGLIVVHIEASAAHIDGLYVSCRALDRDIEKALIGAVADWARGKGAAQLEGRIAKTARNGPVRDVYARCGFAPIEEGETESLWRYDLRRGPIPVPSWLQVSGPARAEPR